MQLHITPGDDVPIYRQIVHQIAEAIAGGKLLPGDVLTSEAALAQELVTRPSNIEKAYDLLERDGLIRTQVGRVVAPRETITADTMKAEIGAATAIQRNLMPRIADGVPGFDICAAYWAANNLSGDFYDLFRANDGRFVVAIGDVTGHGLGPALIAATAQSGLRTCLRLNAEPSMALATLNDDLCERTDEGTFVTLFLAFLSEDGRGEYVNAGHPTPLLWRASTRRIEALRVTGPALGMIESRSMPPEASDYGSLSLDPGDVLVGFSDGLIEARSKAEPERFFGNAGVERVLLECIRRSLPVRGIAQRLTRAARELAGVEDEDDLTVLVIRRK